MLDEDIRTCKVCGGVLSGRNKFFCSYRCRGLWDLYNTWKARAIISGLSSLKELFEMLDVMRLSKKDKYMMFSSSYKSFKKLLENRDILLSLEEKEAGVV